MSDQRDSSLKLTPLATFVVFDRQSGDVLHTHHVSAAPGAVPPPEDELTKLILDHAVHATGRHARDVDCMKVAAGDVKPQSTYRVDLDGRRLVETTRGDDRKAAAARSPQA